MGMYTELIFGASFKKNTPQKVIETLQYMIGDLEEVPEELQFETTSGRMPLISGSYSFGVCKAVSKLYYDPVRNCWSLSSRSNLKNYEDEIESFLNWIKPYIDSGSGQKDMYAIVTYEEDEDPTIFYLRE